MAGDTLLAINGQSLEKVSLSQINKLLTGEKGQIITILLLDIIQFFYSKLYPLLLLLRLLELPQALLLCF